jgi:hypothetical protein
LPPEVSLPESGRASPKFRSAAGYSTLQRGGTYLKKGRLPILKKGSLLFLLLLFVWFTFDWWYLSRFQLPSYRFANTSTTIQVNRLLSLRPFFVHQRFLLHKISSIFGKFVPKQVALHSNWNTTFEHASQSERNHWYWMESNQSKS